MADAPKSGRRLDPETLAGYVDGRLPPDERSRVEAELAADPDSYEWLVHTLKAEQFVDETVPKAPPEEPFISASGSGTGPKRSQERQLREGGQKLLPFYRRRGVVAVVVPVLAAAAALVLVVRLQPAWWQSLWGPAVDPRFAKLVAAVGEERYIEGRLTSGFKYGPLRSVTRGLEDLSSKNLELLAAASELQQAVQADPSAQNIHALGVAQLLASDHDAAIATLQAAAKASNDSPLILSDLAAAFGARAAVRAQRGDWEQAFSLAGRALDRSPRLPEALFNRALAALRLRDPSRVEHWRRYLEVEIRPEWRALGEEYARTPFPPNQSHLLLPEAVVRDGSY